MRKTTRLFLSTLIAILAAGQLSSPYMALAATETATEWTVAELLDYKEELVSAACDDGDIGCRMQTLYFLEWTTGQNAALITFLNQLFLVTTINPSAENLTVLYPAEDLMGGMLRSGNSDTVTSLYLGWFDEGQESLIYNYDYYSFTSDSNPSIHTIYAENTETKERGWIKTGEETRLTVSGSNLVQNTSGILGVAFESDSANMAGNIRYTTCLTARNYHDGMECRLVFNERGEYFYRPYEAPALPEEPSVDEPITTEPENTAPEEPTLPAEPENTPVDPGVATEVSPEESAPVEENPIPLTPPESEISTDIEPSESAELLGSPDLSDLLVSVSPEETSPEIPSQEQPADVSEESPLVTADHSYHEGREATEGLGGLSQAEPLELPKGSSMKSELPEKQLPEKQLSSQAVAAVAMKSLATVPTSDLPLTIKNEEVVAREDIVTSASVSAERVIASGEKTTTAAKEKETSINNAATSAAALMGPSKNVELPAAGQETTNNFPWWIVVIVVSGLGLALWWLLPNNRKTDKA